MNLLKSIGKLVLVIVIPTMAFLLYGLYVEPKAQRSAQEFCGNVRPGQVPTDILSNALLAGASERGLSWQKDARGEQVLYVTFVGVPPFSRHMCKIVAADVVKATEYIYLD